MLDIAGWVFLGTTSLLGGGLDLPASGCHRHHGLESFLLNSQQPSALLKQHQKTAHTARWWPPSFSHNSGLSLFHILVPERMCLVLLMKEKQKPISHTAKDAQTHTRVHHIHTHRHSTAIDKQHEDTGHPHADDLWRYQTRCTDLKPYLRQLLVGGLFAQHL